MKKILQQMEQQMLQKMEQQMKDFADTMRELGKAQRDEARRLRESSGRPGGR